MKGPRLDNTVRTQKQIVDAFSEAVTESSKANPDALLDASITLNTAVLGVSHAEVSTVLTKLKTWLTTLKEDSFAQVAFEVKNADVVGAGIVRSANANVQERVQTGKLPLVGLPQMPPPEAEASTDAPEGDSEQAS